MFKVLVMHILGTWRSSCNLERYYNEKTVMNFRIDSSGSTSSVSIFHILSFVLSNIRGCIQKFPDWPPGARTANVTALCHYMQLYRYFVSQSSEFCRHNPLRCFSTSVFFFAVISLSSQSGNFWIHPRIHYNMFYFVLFTCKIRTLLLLTSGIRMGSEGI
jgi:hypothetical protein